MTLQLELSRLKRLNAEANKLFNEISFSLKIGSMSMDEYARAKKELKEQQEKEDASELNKDFNL